MRIGGTSPQRGARAPRGILPPRAVGIPFRLQKTATMEDGLSPSACSENQGDPFIKLLNAQRARMKEFLVSRRRAWEGARAELLDQAAEIRRQLEEAAAEASRSREAVELVASEACRRLEEQLRAAEQQRDRLQEELEAARRRQAELTAEMESARQREAEYASQLATVRGRLVDSVAALENERSRQADFEIRIQAAAERESRLRQELEAAQRRLTEAAAEQEAAALRAAEANSRLDAARARLGEAIAELESAKARQADLDAQLAASLACQTELAAELHAAREQQSTSAGMADPHELDALRAERDSLAEHLAQSEARMAAVVKQLSLAEERLEKVSQQGSANDSGNEYQRRYELALEDLRELKSRNEALQKELAAARSAAGSFRPGGGGLDWEAEKRRILAALESESGNDNQERAEERIKIAAVVEKTDQALAQKEREIEELKQLLENQTANLGTVAVGAAALGEILDRDAIIREERDNLRRLQAEWEEKLRQAEIELSVERATLARQRVELEEKLREIENSAERARQAETTGSQEKPARGRWRARLGLKESSEG